MPRTTNTNTRSLATIEICRRVTAVRDYSSGLYFDASSPGVGRLDSRESALWAQWQRLRSGRCAQAQHSTALMARVAGALFVATCLASGSGWSGASSAVIVTAVVFALACLVVALLERELAGQPGYLRWSIRKRLDRKTRHRVDLQPLRASLDNERCGAAANEARLVVVAVDIVESIRRSPVWRTGYLDDNHCRHDLQRELAVLSRHALDLLGSRMSREKQRCDDADDDCRQAWSALIVRVALLYQYQILVEQLAEQDVAIGGRHGPTTSALRTRGHTVDELRWVIICLREMNCVATGPEILTDRRDRT